MVLSDILTLGYECFHSIHRYHMGDEVISSTINNFPINTDLIEVYRKVVLINSLYGTAIYDTFKIAEYICSLNIDTKIQSGDISLIDDIRVGHGILTPNNNQYNFYSFATKYSNWHSPEYFPIYDNLVKRLLFELNNEFNFHDNFEQIDLSNYATLKAVIDSITNFTNLQHFRYKKIDTGLWVYAKFKYMPNTLPEDCIQTITNALNIP